MSFIVIEGVDGVGKSTQARLLYEKLAQCGLENALFSFSDYESQTGKFIEDHLHGRVSMMTEVVTASNFRRSQHDALAFQCAQICDKYARAGAITAALSRGQVVVSDRWWQSGLAYGVDDGLDPEWLKSACSCLPQAGLNLLLDASPDSVAARRTSPGDRYERDSAKQRRVRQSYLDLWHDPLRGCGEWEILSGEGSREEVHGKVVKAVQGYLSLFYGRSSVTEKVLKAILAEVDGSSTKLRG